MATTEAEFYEEAKSYAATCIGNIGEMLDKLEHARNCNGEQVDGHECEHVNDADWYDEDEAQQAIDDDPLSIQVRGGWHSVGETAEDEEYEILLTTGGPAARIVGTLDQYHAPESARFEYQDWFKPWTEVILDHEDHTIIMDYANHFYFGE